MAHPDSTPTAWELMLSHQVQALSEKLNEVIEVANKQEFYRTDVEKIDIDEVK